MDEENNKIQTLDINNSLAVYAKNNLCQQQELDFNIISTKTIMAHKSSMIVLDLEQLDKYKNQKMPIKQSYEIEIFNKKSILNINSSISILELNSKAIMHINKIPKLVYYDELENDLITYIRKEKAKQNILIDTQDEELVNNVSTLVKAIKENKVTEETLEIQIYNSTSFIPSRKGYIKYPYIPHIKYQEVNKNFIFTKKDCVIVEMFQGTNGQSGFDCLGELVSPKPVGKMNTSKIRNGSNVRRMEKENDDYVYLMSDIDGMVSCSKWTFSVGIKFNFIDLNCKYFRSFQAPIDEKDIEIKVIEGNKGNDAIGSNIRISVHTIEVKGNVGSNVKIECQNIKVTGSAHKASSITAQKCFIQSAKGYVHSQDIEIAYLEQGELHGGVVNVQHLQGGKAMGKNVSIQNIHSNGFVMASQSIELVSINGSNNEFIICANGSNKFSKTIKELQNRIKIFNAKYTKTKLQELKDKYDLYIKKATELKKIIGRLKSNKKDYSKEMNIIKKIISAMEQIKEIFAQKKQAMEYLLQLRKYDSLLTRGVVTAKSNWHKDNIVIFKKVATISQVSVSPEPNIKKLTLEKHEDKEIILMDI